MVYSRGLTQPESVTSEIDPPLRPGPVTVEATTVPGLVTEHSITSFKEEMRLSSNLPRDGSLAINTPVPVFAAAESFFDSAELNEPLSSPS